MADDVLVRALIPSQNLSDNQEGPSDRNRSNARKGIQRRRSNLLRRIQFERLQERLVFNGLPFAQPDSLYSTPLNTALVVTSQDHPLLENDGDPEGSTLSVSIVANPANGALSNVSSSAGTYTYTPNTGFTGIDTFTYKVNDGTSDGNTVTASVAVGGHFGPRTNVEETSRQVAGCSLGSKLMDVTASCLTGGLTYAQTLTPTSALLYSSDTLPQPLIVLETFLMPTSSVPDEIKAQLTFNGTAGTLYSYGTTGLQAGQALRFALQADATSLATGRYAYTVALTARFGGSSVTRSYSGNYEVINRSASTHEFGRGWQLAGLDKLVSGTGGMMLASSSGEALWFADNGSGGYHRATGDDTFSTLVRNGDNTYTLTAKHGEKNNFSSAGLLTSRVDGNNNTVTFTYTSGLLTQVADPFNRNMTLGYTNGRLTSITDVGSRTATLAYDSNGRLTSVTQPDPDTTGPLASPVWSFAYDTTTHQLTQRTDPLNLATSFTYGSAHKRLTTITHPDTTTWQITSLQTIGLPPNTSGNSLVAANPLGSVTNELNNQSTFRTDSFGNITEWNNPLAHKTLVARNVDGLPTKMTEPDPDGTGSQTSPITILGYDALGNLKFQRNPDNSTKTWNYTSSFNLVSSATDELGRVNSSGYDSSGNLTSSTDAAGYITSLTHTSRGFVASTTSPDPDGAGPLSASVKSYSYDTNGRLTTLTNPDNSTRTFTYDSADNRLTETDELNHTTSFAFDKLGRKTSTTDRVNGTTSFTYNALGLLTKQTDALGNATDHEYNNRNFLTKTLKPDPDGAGSLGRPETALGYDAVGNLTTLGEPTYFSMPMTHTYDAANRRTRTRQTLNATNIDTNYTYDNLGRLIKVTDPLSHEISYEYNSRGWLTKTTGQDPDGYYGSATSPVTQYGYDAVGQRTSETDPLGFTTSYTFNSRGLQATNIQPDPDGTGPEWAQMTSYSYDNAGRLTTIHDPYCRTTTYVYNNRDWKTSITSPDPDSGGPLASSVTSYAYDAAGRNTSVTDPLSRVTSYVYDHEGRRTTMTLPDPDGAGSLTSPVWSWAYNALGTNTSVTDPRGNVTTNAYDILQRLTSTTEPDPDGGGPLSSPVTSFVYNSQGVLSKITDPIGRDTTYGYDGLGRRMSVKDHLNNQTTLAYDSVNRLSSVTSPDPDGAGSLTAPVTTYDYDDLNRLTTVGDTLNGQTRFTYDAAGHVLTLEDPVENTTSWSYDNMGRLAIETNELGHSRSFSFDAVSNLSRRADRNGRVIQYERDDLNRITAEKWYQNGTPTPSIAIATATQGGPVNEVQRVGFSATTSVQGGTFALTFNGSTTSAISYDSSAAQVKSALEALSSVGSGNVSVVKLQSSSTAQEWQITFQGSKAATNVVQTTINSTSVSYSGVLTNIEATDAPGVSNADEVQTVTLSNANGGTFRLAFDGQTTAPISQNASASTLDSALEALNSVDLVSVTGNAGGPWTVTFVGSHTNTNVAQMNADASSLTSGTLARTLSYSYDAANQLASASDADSSYAYTYDNLGRVLTVDNNGTSGVPRVILTSAFDANSNRTSLAATVSGTNDFLNSYIYDNLNRLTRVDQNGHSGGNSVAEKRVDLSYNALGQFTQVARYKDTDGGSTHEVATSTFSYDSLGRLTGLAHKKGGTNLFTPYAWTYDSLSQVGAAHQLPGVGVDPRLGGPVLGSGVPLINLSATASFQSLGRVTQVTSQDGTTSYTHDATSQLTGADHSYQTDESFSYDANGNRTMSGYQTGSNNRLLNDGIYSYQYDNEGNRTRKTKTSDNSYTEYEWDFRNRLTKVTERNSSAQIVEVVEYKYDVFDRRISRAVDTTSSFDLQDAAIERYLYDNVNGVASLDGGNVVLDFVDPDGPGGSTSITLAKRYLYGPAVDHLFAQEDVTKSASSADRILWPLVDHLQTVRDLAKNDGTIATHYKFDSFGKVTSGDTSLTRYLFTSREFDEAVGLQYNRARYYDVTVGRFTSEDLKGFEAGDASLARYVGNIPTEFSDPSGMDVYEWLDSVLTTTINFGGGFADVATIGLRPTALWLLGAEDVVDSTSMAYKFGAATPFAIVTVFAAVSAVAALPAEFALTIPTAWPTALALSGGGTAIVGATTTVMIQVKGATIFGAAALVGTGALILMSTPGSDGADLGARIQHDIAVLNRLIRTCDDALADPGISGSLRKTYEYNLRRAKEWLDEIFNNVNTTAPN